MNIDIDDPYAEVAEQRVLRLFAAFHSGDETLFSSELTAIVNETVGEADDPLLWIGHLLAAFTRAGSVLVALVAITYSADGEVSYETSYMNALHAIERTFGERRQPG